jgi:hypothetical protein
MGRACCWCEGAARRGAEEPAEGRDGARRMGCCAKALSPAAGLLSRSFTLRRESPVLGLLRHPRRLDTTRE